MHLFIATPCYGGMVTRNFMLSMIQLNNALQQRHMPYSLSTLGGEALICRARNGMVAQFLAEKQATHLLFIDADQKFDPETVFRLIDHGGEIVASTIPKKEINWDQVYARMDACRSPEDLRSLATSFVLDQRPEAELFPEEIIESEIVDGFVQTAYIGTGMMLIARTALEKMKSAMPELQYQETEVTYGISEAVANEYYDFFGTMLHPKTNRYLSEDYAFCHRWRSCGGTLWADLKSNISHEGAHVFQSSFARRLALLGSET